MRALAFLAFLGFCLACGGDTTSTDGGTCDNEASATGCACSLEAGTIEGTCACAQLIGCKDTRWACYPLAPGCPQTAPAESSACSDSTLACDYVHANGTADELVCDGAKWNVVIVTTYCK